MKPLFASLLLLFSVTGSITAFTAETEAPRIDDERADAVSDNDTASDEALEDAFEDDEQTGADAGDGAGNSAGASEPRDPNEPFVPSVQISEDLSVSFPVDI